MHFLLESLRVAYRTFIARGTEKVFGSRCCQRIYIGDRPAMKCRTCPKVPVTIPIASEADIDSLVRN